MSNHDAFIDPIVDRVFPLPPLPPPNLPHFCKTMILLKPPSPPPFSRIVPLDDMSTDVRHLASHLTNLWFVWEGFHLSWLLFSGEYMCGEHDGEQAMVE